MDLILNLQNDILEPDRELSSILRKAKVLASALKNREIKVWADNELNGYDSEDKLPEYRKFFAINRGDFINYSSMFKNIPISIINIQDESIRETLAKNYVYNGVKTLESAINTGDKELKIRWPSELIQIYSQSFYQNAECIDAYRVFPVGFYEQILDDIKTRLLDFLLELQDKYPEIKEPSSDTQKIPEGEVTKIFNTTVYGGQCSIGNELHNCQVVNQYVQKNNLTSLIDYLNKIGVPSTEVEILKTSIQNDSKDGNSKEIGSHVKNWISNISGKVLSGAVDKTLDISLDLIKVAILAYYGLK